jgi:hypothetical protein
MINTFYLPKNIYCYTGVKRILLPLKNATKSRKYQYFQINTCKRERVPAAAGVNILIETPSGRGLPLFIPWYTCICKKKKRPTEGIEHILWLNCHLLKGR